jgi:hypothetical protein
MKKLTILISISIVLLLTSCNTTSFRPALADKHKIVSEIAGYAGGAGFVTTLPISFIALPATIPLSKYCTKPDAFGIGATSILLSPSTLSALIMSEVIARPVWVLAITADGVKYVYLKPFSKNKQAEPANSDTATATSD